MRSSNFPAGASEAAPDLDQARAWLDYVQPRPQQQRARVAFALFNGWGDAAEPDFIAWLRTHPEHNAAREGEGRTTWRSARNPGPTTWRALRGMAWDGGWRPDPNAPPPRRLSPEDLAQQRAVAELARRKSAIPPDPDFQPAAIWARGALDASTHSYTLTKNGQPQGLRVVPSGDPLRQMGESLVGWLIAPVWRDGIADGELSSLQFIAPVDVAERLKAANKPTKLNLFGHPLDGCFIVGEHAPGGVIYVCESVSAAWPAHQATGNPAIVAFGWGNVRRESQAQLARDPAARLVLLPDVGKEDDAHAIARELGAVVAAMPTGWPRNSDIGDYAQREGLDALRALLTTATDPTEPAPPQPPAGPVGSERAPGAARRSHEASQGDDEGDKRKGGRPSALDVALALTADLELFHDAGGSGHFAAEGDGRREVWPVQSRSGADLLARRYFAATGRGLPAQTVKDALATLDARARFQGEPREIFLRVARFDDRVLIDLADDRWRVIEVTARGWRVLDRSPVAFVRRAGMAPLPEPQRGGSVVELREFLNVGDADFLLVVAWLLGALGGRGPFPALILQAEQGAGKSTASRVLRALVDPADVPLKAPPRNADDWAIAALTAYVLALDNLSRLTSEQADFLCRLLTGAGITKRRLYSDLDEIQFHLSRPALLNGIDAIATRPDLADRSLVVTLPTITAARRRQEAAFWETFDAARPRLLGALLDAVSGALRCRGNAPPPDLPRMADFAAWICAAEPALGWPAGTFLRAYRANIAGAAEAAVEASPVGVAVLALLHREPSVTYNATALMPALEHAAPDWAPRSPAWPRSPRGLADSIRRLTAPLLQLGIEIFEHRDKGGRWITLRRRPQSHPNTTDDEVIFEP